MNVLQRLLSRGSQASADTDVIDLRDSSRRTGQHGSPLPRFFRIEKGFQPLKRIVHWGEADHRELEVRLTMADSINLHSTGIERPLGELEGHIPEAQHLQVLVDLFGRDTWASAEAADSPPSLPHARQQWQHQIADHQRYGFAMNNYHLVSLEYRPPTNDPRDAEGNAAYKRIAMVYPIAAIER